MEPGRSAAEPPLVYLDTQDYSRFADALVGRGDSALVGVYDQLLDLKRRGLVRFGYSAAIVSELLQYEASERELTYRKARVIQELCDGHALLYHGRLIAFEFAQVAHGAGLLSRLRGPRSALSTDNDWFPPFVGALKGMRERFDERRKSIIAEETAGVVGMNRQRRRQLERRVQKVSYAELVRGSIDKFAAEWPISREFAERYFTGFLDGRVSEAELGRRFRQEFTMPEQYVGIYFERYSGEKDIPAWMRDFGGKLLGSMVSYREAADLIRELPDAKTRMRRLLKASAPRLVESLSEIAASEGEEFGLTPEVVGRIRATPELLRQVPSYRMLTRWFVEYVAENSGVYENSRAPLASDGGDLMHALYMSHCDLWRSDAYFAGLMRRVVPPGMATVVQRLTELPDRIRERAGLMEHA